MCGTSSPSLFQVLELWRQICNTSLCEVPQQIPANFAYRAAGSTAWVVQQRGNGAKLASHSCTGESTYLWSVGALLTDPEHPSAAREGGRSVCCQAPHVLLAAMHGLVTAALLQLYFTPFVSLRKTCSVLLSFLCCQLSR